MAGALVTPESSYILIGTVLVAHWTCAMSMVFINKALVSGRSPSADISLFIVWIQNLIGVALIQVMNLVTIIVGGTWERAKWDLSTLLHPDMIMSSVTFTGTLVFNNLMLKYISVAFYQVARSLTLIFVITLSMIILQEKITSRVVVASLFIVMGFYIGVDQEMLSTGVNPLGIMYAVIASLLAALCGIFFKRVQKKKMLSSVQLTFNNCLISSLGLTPLIFSTSQLNNFLYSSMSEDLTARMLLFLSGIMSLSMGWLSALQISLTSPLTHNISINAKSLFQTVLAVIWSGESRAWLWWLGNGLVMTGIATYTAHKLNPQTRASLNMDVEIQAPHPTNRNK
ncbi:GDP-fucose transporter [Biomphalaria pfeifferi]|uniref:GDP-fucose transporter n=1 Tax=Biomphalaria pfeifferi TaxID=112525 RepID=A0AAD8FFL8_BIOPF|nr:GDP-fucose transporter [Biomphalaria pfeifferi]